MKEAFRLLNKSIIRVEQPDIHLEEEDPEEEMETEEGNGKEGNVLFNDALNTFYLRLYGVSLKKEGRKEMFYLTTHSTHFIYGYMASV